MSDVHVFGFFGVLGGGIVFNRVNQIQILTGFQSIRQLQTSTAVGSDAYNGTLDCFRKIIKNEGFSRLYRGITAPILMEAPKRATKFAANDEWGKFYRNAFGQEKMTQGLSVLTGASAGATESFVVVPLYVESTPSVPRCRTGTDADTFIPSELIKIRLQDKVSASKYNGPVDVLLKTVKNEGLLALYTGLESTMWRHILWNAGYFGCIHQVRQLLPKAETKKGQMASDIVAGSVGGTGKSLLLQSPNCPLWTIETQCASPYSS